MSSSAARGTIALSEAEIIFQQSYPGEQYILRVAAADCARRAIPGSFAHLTCDDALRLRRPLSIMRAHKSEGWLEFLYKPVGSGLVKLAQRRAGERLSLLAPIGNGFTPHPGRRTVLALGGGVGIPPMIFLAEHLKNDARWRTIVFAASEVPFPFELASKPTALPGVPTQATAGLKLLEQWGVPSRLASQAALSGCFPGLITDLARAWLVAQTPDELAQTQLLGCGPMPMLRAVADLARSFELPCQVAVEEYMACGVGGCAGCTIPIATASGPAMRRVCVDGPVFGADEVFPPRP